MQLAAAFKHKVPEKDTYVDYEAIISQQKSKSAKFFTAKPTNQLNTPNYQFIWASKLSECYSRKIQGKKYLASKSSQWLQLEL